jgi:hypothetical protein
MNGSDDGIQIKETISVEIIISEKSNPGESLSFPSSIVSLSMAIPLYIEEFHSLWLVAMVTDMCIKNSKYVSVPIWMVVIFISQNHHICVIWATCVERILTPSHVIYCVVDLDNLMMIDVVVFECDGISLSITILRFSHVSFALDL